ncbi:hypothetical protein DAPPUDRAFT_277145 [Daphnia pulex]|uniref:Uncharacterized protein n=1 Tax=Daphnia pulex TaxID=6669 RepID=E9I682_DAPPU|nr:hypothetical protein DAPPUDRAFT_277145 [Daphnia pulex]|eukprot:EFX60498.1 hypothetical protein DAPPUDRAFT_277145 [Daphnia pulex]
MPTNGTTTTIDNLTNSECEYRAQFTPNLPSPSLTAQHNSLEAMGFEGGYMPDNGNDSYEPYQYVDATNCPEVDK